MIWTGETEPVYRGSGGGGAFRLASGQRLSICADDGRIEAEMRRRGLWAKTASVRTLGTSFAVLDTDHGGADFFVWFGRAEDGGFLWYSFPGAGAASRDVRSFMAFLDAALLGGGPAKSGGGSGDARP